MPKPADVTKLKISDTETVSQCNDCGAYSLIDAAHIKHFKTCKPGESRKWVHHYGECDNM
jgi:hypothetical protein